MERICIVCETEHRPFYESMEFEEEQLHFFDLTEALQSVGRCGFSVMVLDAGHSPETGLQLLKRIKQCCVSTPVVFLTDASSEELAIAVFRSGAREYFKKPVDVSVLLATVMDLARIRRVTVDTRLPLTPHPTENRGEAPLGRNSDLPDGILKTLHYLKENLGEKIYLDEVADQAGMSKFHFCRIFKNHVGMTPMQYLTVNRIERAKHLMRKAGPSITSIIYKVGFNDVSEFNRQFKKVTGTTPSAFRDTMKQREGELIAS